jgi:hypothetical protein
LGKKRESKRIKQFDEQEQVNIWYLANTNEKQARKHKRKLQIVCSTLKISPESLIMDIPPEQQIIKIKEVLAKFVRAVKEGKLVHTHNNKQKHITDFNEYETALKNFVGHFHHVPVAKLLPSSETRSYVVEMSDNEITTFFAFLSTYKDDRYIQLASLQHEIFCRFHALLNWDVNGVEIGNDEIDGVKIEWAIIPKFYEPKQKKHFEKLILNPHILRMLKNMKKGEIIVPKDEQEEFSRKYHNALRKAYSKLGFIEMRKKYELGSDQWYWSNKPTHCLRKSGSAQALRRCKYDYSLVAGMGWSDEKILRNTYAQPKIMLNQNICEYCNPSAVKQKNERFCCFEHYLTYRHSGNKAKKQETKEQLLEKLAKWTNNEI